MIKICYVYNEGFLYLKNMFLESLEPSKNRIVLCGKQVVSKHKDSGFGSKSWYDFTRMKIEFLYEQYCALKDNEIILCSDVDVCFKDSEKALNIIENKFKENEELDLIGMSENNNAMKTVINTGFFAVRKSSKMDLFFKNVLSINFEGFKFADQDVINLWLISTKINYETLDNNQFTNGCFITKINNPDSILLVHATCCYTLEEKINLIHKICNIKYDILMVVAKYQESIEWIRKAEIPHLIYNKSPQKHQSNKIEKLNIIHIDNIGFEEFVYLSYIVDNYYSLPERIIFTQADPFPHSPFFSELIKPKTIWSHKDVQPMSNYWSKEVPGYSLTSNTENILNVNNKYHVHVDFFNSLNQRYDIKKDCFNWFGKGQKHHTPSFLKFFDTENLRKKIFDLLEIKPRNFNDMEITPMCYAAIFSVKQEQILKHPLLFYEKLLGLSRFYNHKFFAMLMEMAWLEIFGYEPPEELYDKKKYQEFQMKPFINKSINQKTMDDRCEFVIIPIKKNKKQYTCIYCQQNINQYDYLNSRHVYNCPVKIKQILRHPGLKHYS